MLGCRDTQEFRGSLTFDHRKWRKVAMNFLRRWWHLLPNSGVLPL